jgi:DNA-binding CsgD family transcriptional regulator
MDPETRQFYLKQTRRHIEAAESAVARQKVLLEKVLGDSRLGAEAQRLLLNFEDLVSVFNARLALLQGEAISQKIRPADDEPCDEEHQGICALTARERDVLCWIARGKTAAEIGMILGISPRTVESYIRDAVEKLDTVNRVQAVVKALQLRLITVESV